MIFKLFFIFSLFLYGALAIRNGEKVEIDEFPYQVSIVRKTDGGFIHHKCAGVIMNSNWIMTVNKFPLQIGGEVNTRDRVFAGSNRLDPTYFKNWESGHEIVKVISLIGQNKMNFGSWNGVKLIKLKTPIQMNNKTIASACFVDEKENPKPYYGKELVLSGWGREHSLDNLSGVYKNMLHKTKAMEDISFTDDTYYSEDLIHVDSNISAACNGDNGGPLTYTSNGKKYVVGLHYDKIGFWCAGRILYTRISYFLDSIKEMIDTPICIKKFNEL